MVLDPSQANIAAAAEDSVGFDLSQPDSFNSDARDALDNPIYARLPQAYFNSSAFLELIRAFGYDGQVNQAVSGGFVCERNLLDYARLYHVLNLRYLSLLHDFMACQRNSSSSAACSPISDKLGIRLKKPSRSASSAPKTVSPKFDNHACPDAITYVLTSLGLQLSDASTFRCALMNRFPKEGSYKTHIVAGIWSTRTQVDEGFERISRKFVSNVLDARLDVGDCPSLCDSEMKLVLLGLLQDAKWSSDDAHLLRRDFLSQLQRDCIASTFPTLVAMEQALQVYILKTGRFRSGPRYKEATISTAAPMMALQASPAPPLRKKSFNADKSKSTPSSHTSSASEYPNARAAGAAPPLASSSHRAFDSNAAVRRLNLDNPDIYRDMSAIVNKFRDYHDQPSGLSALIRVTDLFPGDARKDQKGRVLPIHCYPRTAANDIVKLTPEIREAVHNFFWAKVSRDVTAYEKVCTAFEYMYHCGLRRSPVSDALKQAWTEFHARSKSKPKRDKTTAYVAQHAAPQAPSHAPAVPVAPVDVPRVVSPPAPAPAAAAAPPAYVQGQYPSQPSILSWGGYPYPSMPMAPGAYYAHPGNSTPMGYHGSGWNSGPPGPPQDYYSNGGNGGGWSSNGF